MMTLSLTICFCHGKSHNGMEYFLKKHSLYTCLQRYVSSIAILKLSIFEKDTQFFRNNHLRFVLYSNGQIYDGYFAKLCVLL